MLCCTENREFVSFQLLRRSRGCVSKSDDRCTASSQKGARLGKVRTSSNEKLSFCPKKKWKEIIDLKGKWEVENITFGILLQSNWPKFSLSLIWFDGLNSANVSNVSSSLIEPFSLKCLKVCWLKVKVKEVLNQNSCLLWKRGWHFTRLPYATLKVSTIIW